MKVSSKITIIVFVLLISSILFAQQILSDSEIEEKVKAIISKMTLEEKIGQMTQFSGDLPQYESMIKKGKIGSLLNVYGAKKTNRLQKIAIEKSRLGIPLIFGLDVIHGYRTVFPIPLASAASWDTALVRKAASIAAKEASSEGINWTFAPMVDIARDPRWGRIAEGAGEDTFLGSAMARAQVLGFQGKSLAEPLTILACAKHFVGYGAAEGGRDYNTTELSERTLREVYLPPFKAAVDAGVGSLMSAFNDISGIPATANGHTITDILKGEWNFNGFVVSDWNSIGELIDHGIAANLEKAGKKALEAGVDMDMEGRAYSDKIVKEGNLSEELVNESVRRILRMKYRLGLFDNPYTDESSAEDLILNDEHKKIALELSRESIVLLKNKKGLLPLRKDIGKIAVIGPLADDKNAPLGSWACVGKSEDVVTVLEGINKKLYSTTEVYYAKGCDVKGSNKEGFKKAVKIAKKAEISILVVGESANMSGEAASRSTLDLPGVQRELVQAVYKTGTPVIVVLMNGRPLSIPTIIEEVPAVLETWFLGVQCGNAIADILFGDYNPSGKLPVTFPRSVGQIPVYYNHKNSGRPNNPSDKFTSKYIDLPSSPLFPFGYGLSYTKFKYSDLRISSKKITSSENLLISVDVENIGDREGDEIVQLYIHDIVASVTRPVKELRGFCRISVAPNEEKRVEFILKPINLGFYDQNMKYIVEPGKFEVMIGGNSLDLLRTSFEVVEK